MSSGREAQVVDTFLTLADTLVRDFDPVDMLSALAERSSELLEVPAAGIILLDSRGGLSVAAASTKRSRLLEDFAVAIDSGPCLDCVRTGRTVTCEDLTTVAATDRWPRYSRGAAEAGFRATHAVPMRLRDDVIGVLTLLHTEPHALVGDDARLAQGLADAATIGLLHERAVRRAETTHEQLQNALTSRIIIEQAKGVLVASAETDIDPAAAFTLLRSYARARGVRLTDVARGVVDRSVDAVSVLGR